jgi:DNA-directed RNA polymerase specialized sigma24 family protein
VGCRKPAARRAIRRLNETQRLILFLHFYLDLPVEEVGRVLGLSADGVRSRMYRATRSLRLVLKEPVYGRQVRSPVCELWAWDGRDWRQIARWS